MIGSKVGNSGNELRISAKSSELLASSEMVSREMIREFGIERAWREDSLAKEE